MWCRLPILSVIFFFHFAGTGGSKPSKEDTEELAPPQKAIEDTVARFAMVELPRITHLAGDYFLAGSHLYRNRGLENDEIWVAPETVHHIAVTGNDVLYFSSGRRLYRSIGNHYSLIGTAPGPIDHLAAADNGALFIASGSDLYVLEGDSIKYINSASQPIWHIACTYDGIPFFSVGRKIFRTWRGTFLLVGTAPEAIEHFAVSGSDIYFSSGSQLYVMKSGDRSIVPYEDASPETIEHIVSYNSGRLLFSTVKKIRFSKGWQNYVATILGKIDHLGVSMDGSRIYFSEGRSFYMGKIGRKFEEVTTLTKLTAEQAAKFIGSRVMLLSSHLNEDVLKKVGFLVFENQFLESRW